MSNTISRFTLVAAIGALAVMSGQAGSLEPPPGPVSPTRPPDTCYDNTGNRFVDCGDGTIKDTESGLYWLKNVSCLGTKNWADANKDAANLAHGQCGLTDGSLPGDWRLPTLECPSGGICNFSTPPTGEFATILTPFCPEPYLRDTAGTGCWSEGNPFSGVQSATYWSATPSTASPTFAWTADLFNGAADLNGKGNLYLMWPVRGGP